MPPFPSIHGLHLDRVLGTGNSGTVYAARQSGGLELEVAVKVIHPHLIYSELDARFEVEKAALASLRHPGIAHVLDSGTSDEGLPYLVMERVDGQSIDEYCDRNRLGVEERLEVFLQAAGAVEAAHLQGILHRDLKPANILVTDTADGPVVKIIDFGLAKMLDPLPEHALESMAGSQLGTPLYMAPEQFGFAGPVDTRADVHALGAVLYELLTGRHVVDVDALEGLDIGQQRDLLTKTPRIQPSDRVRQGGDDADAIARARGTDVRALSRRLRGELDAICLHALAHDREERYPSAQALAEDLRRHLRDEPLQMSTPSLAYVLRKSAARNRPLAVTVVVALIAIAGLGVGLVDATREARQQARDARSLSDFLLGHFSGQDTAVGDEALPRAEVDRAYEELRARDPAPESEDAVRAYRRMSLAYEQLGDPDRADTVLLDGIDLVLRPVAADSSAALDLVLDRARLALRSERHDRADTLGRHVLRESERIGAGELSTLAHSVLGRLEIRRGRPGDAIPHFRAALETKEFRGARWSEEARLRSDLGLALNKVRRHDEAAAELRAALGLLDTHGGGRPAERARVLHNLGVSLCEMEDYAAAVPLLEEAVRLQRSLPERRGALGSTLNDLANAVWGLGDDSRALVLYLEALKVKREVFGHDSATTVSTLSSLGDIQEKQGRHAEAVRSYRDAVAILTAARSPDHPTIAIVSYNLGNVLEKMGLLPEALRSYAEAARVDSLHLGEDHPYVVESREAVDRVRVALEAGP